VEAPPVTQLDRPPSPLTRAIACPTDPPGERRLSPRLAFIENRLQRRGPRAMAKNCPSLIESSRLRVNSVISARPAPSSKPTQARAPMREPARAPVRRRATRARTARPTGGGLEHEPWTRGEDAACRLPGAAGPLPARIAKLEGRRASLRASFVPSCLCGWPWLPGYNYQLIVLETDIVSQNPAPGKLPCQKQAHLARPASRYHATANFRVMKKKRRHRQL
jgi:hypothetical protein